jgi:rare lipoprotein A
MYVLPGLGQGMAYTRATRTLILTFFGVIAPSVLLASDIPVRGGTFSSKAVEQTIRAAIQGRALAALEPTFDIPLDGETAATAPAVRITLSPDEAVIGMASFYEGAQETASGEQYDPAAFTAAAQLEIRDKFGGIRFGKNYQPTYAIGEYDGKKIIVKFNDVGPLKPGRKFDLSRAAMAHFDVSLEKGLLPDFKMTPLPAGQVYATGPVSDEQLVAMGIAYGDDAVVTASIANTPVPADETETPAVQEITAATSLVSEGEQVMDVPALVVSAETETPVAQPVAAPAAADSEETPSPKDRIALAFDELYGQPGQNLAPDAPATLDLADVTDRPHIRGFGVLPGRPDPVWPEETRRLQLVRLWFGTESESDIAVVVITRGQEIGRLI